MTISGVRGMGGVGKTSLALKLAEQLTPRYPDAQFYLDLRGISPQPLSSADAMAHVIRAYHPTIELPESEAQLSGLYRSVLHGQRALLLMDNAAGAEQVAPLVPASGCVLLVTSRQHFALPGLLSLNLEELPPADARALLLAIAPRLDYSLPLREESGDRSNAADEIARLCGYLPLALRLAGSALAERIDLSPADYVRRLVLAQTRLELVDASLSLSYDLVRPEMQELWRMLAVFPDTFDKPAAAAVWDLELDPAQDALSELVKYSLVDFLPSRVGKLSDGGGAKGWGRYRLHDLARLFANARLRDSERATGQSRHAGHYAIVTRAARALYERGGEAFRRGLDLFDLEWTNIQQGQAWAQAHAEEDNAAARLCSYYPDAGAYLVDLRLHPREHVRWLRSALAAARRLNDRDAEGVHLGNLGRVYMDLGEIQRAILFFEQVLVIEREIGDRRGEGNALGNLGNAYYLLGEPRRANEFYEQHLEITREIGDRRSEGTMLGSIGATYATFGETRRAIEYLNEALVIAREIGDRRGEGDALGNLGRVYMDLGENRRAIEFLKEALIIAREIGNRRGEGTALGSLANAYADLSETYQAIEFSEQALVIAREISDRRGEGNELGNLGRAYFLLGETRRGIEFHERALAISREIGYRLGEGADLANMGLAHAALGQFSRAIEFYERALVIHREIGDRRGEGNTLGNLGTALVVSGETRRAIDLFEQALAIAREIGDQRGEGNALGNLANSYAILGETHHAIEFYEQVLVTAREIGDRRGESNTLGNLGLAYEALGDSRRAVEFYEQQLLIARQISYRRGEGKAQWNIGLALDKLGDRAQAIAHAEAAFEIFEQIEDPNAAKVRRQLAEWGIEPLKR